MRIFATAAVLAMLLLAACGEAPQVVQGTVRSYDAATKSLIVKDECQQNRELTLDLAGAEIGVEPAASDTVRVSYREASGTRAAIRVMNISREKELSLAGAKGVTKRCASAKP